MLQYFFKDFLIQDSTGDIGPGFTNSLYSHLCNYRRVTHNESLDKCNAIWACIDKYGWYQKVADYVEEPFIYFC